MFPKIVTELSQTVGRNNGRALIVGGSVRDMLMGLPPKDIDIEIYGLEIGEIQEILETLNPEWLDIVGRSFGVLKTKIDGIEIDVSIPRKESKVSEGHKGFVVQGDPYLSPKEAARRRDITINALAYDLLENKILDFFNGQEDLESRVIRATDLEKFGEDPLRVLRVIQFAARLNFAVDEATQDLCRRISQTQEFKNQPAERIGEEWRKMLLKSPKPSVGLELGWRLGVWQVLHPELAALVGVEQEKTWHPEGDVWTHSLMALDEATKIARRENLSEKDALIIMFAALTHDFGKPYTTKIDEKDGRVHSYGHQDAGAEPAKKFLDSINVDKTTQNTVAALVREHMFLAMNKEPTVKSVQRLAHRLSSSSGGNAGIDQLVLVMQADVLGRGNTNFSRFQRGEELLRQAMALGIEKTNPQKIIQGRDLVKVFNWKPGAKFGFVLNNVYQAQLAGHVSNREEALRLAQTLDPDEFLPDTYSHFDDLVIRGEKSEIRHVQLLSLARGYKLSLPHKPKNKGGKVWKQINCIKKQLKQSDISFILQR